jgi:hypothetical protein
MGHSLSNRIEGMNRLSAQLYVSGDQSNSTRSKVTIDRHTYMSLSFSSALGGKGVLG